MCARVGVVAGADSDAGRPLADQPASLPVEQSLVLDGLDRQDLVDLVAKRRPLGSSAIILLAASLARGSRPCSPVYLLTGARGRTDATCAPLAAQRKPAAHATRRGAR